MAAGLPDGHYKLGVNDVVVEDGDAKLASNGVRAGSTLTQAQALRNLMKFTGAPVEEASKANSANPAALFGWADRGHIDEGALADLVLLDEDYEVARTIVGGRTVYADSDTFSYSVPDVSPPFRPGPVSCRERERTAAPRLIPPFAGDHRQACAGGGRYCRVKALRELPQPRRSDEGALMGKMAEETVEIGPGTLDGYLRANTCVFAEVGEKTYYVDPHRWLLARPGLRAARRQGPLHGLLRPGAHGRRGAQPAVHRRQEPARSRGGRLVHASVDEYGQRRDCYDGRRLGPRPFVGVA